MQDSGIGEAVGREPWRTLRRQEQHSRREGEKEEKRAVGLIRLLEDDLVGSVLESISVSMSTFHLNVFFYPERREEDHEERRGKGEEGTRRRRDEGGGRKG